MTNRGPRASLELNDAMGVLQVADALEQMIFTAARGWTRTVRMDQNTRDMLVRSIRCSHGEKKPDG
jgi:hypothetical protein